VGRRLGQEALRAPGEEAGELIAPDVIVRERAARPGEHDDPCAATRLDHITIEDDVGFANERGQVREIALRDLDESGRQ